MRLSATVVAAAAGLALLAAPAAAQAATSEPPLNLAGAYVLDVAGALDGGENEVKEALDKLYDRTKTGLFVVLVDDFDGAACLDWANESAGLSNLGADDVLLAIAVGTREYCASVADDFPLSDAQLDDVANSGFVAELRANDYSGGIVEYANDLSTALVRVSAPSSGGGFPVVPVIGGVAVVGIGAFAVSRAVRKRRGGGSSATPASRAGAPAGQPSQEELDKQAGSLLIALDDAVRESEQELGFAEAQFGAAAVASYQKAVADAKDKLQSAFAIRQQLDDTTPETPEQRRALTTQLIELCTQADAALDAQADEFSQLRNLETSAPQVLATVQSTHASLAGRIQAAETTIARLATEYGAAAVDSVDENPAQARELAGYAAESITKAEAALAAGQASEAAVAVHSAQQAVDQATQLLDGVDALATELPQTADRLAAATAALTSAVAEARAAGGDAALATAIGSAERALAAAQTGDPIARLEAVEKATSELDTALATVRDAQAAAQASRQQYERMRATARERIRQAESYITTRRGGIGASARTRLAEAERLLALAAGLAVSQPAEALDSAQRAITHADAALQIARSDVASFGPQGGGMSMGMPSISLGGISSGRSSGFGGTSRRTSSIGSARTSSSFSSSGSSRRTGGTTGSSRRSSGGSRRGSGGRF